LALLAVLALVLAAWALWPGGRDPGPDVNRLADHVARGEEATVKEEARRVAERYQTIRPVMSLFKERNEKGGGIGVGKELGAVRPDGIEAKITALALAPLTDAELDEQREALIRMSAVVGAVAEVTRLKCEIRQKTGYLEPRAWEAWSDGMRQSARALADAVRARDGARVKAVAVRLRYTCHCCHHFFRE
jgi:hypothetical protein